jgi:hypothetical protein
MNKTVLFSVLSALLGFLLGGLVLRGPGAESSRGPTHEALQLELRSIAERQALLEQLLRQGRPTPARGEAAETGAAPAGTLPPEATALRDEMLGRFAARTRDRHLASVPADLAEIRLAAAGMDGRVGERAERWKRRYGLEDAQIEPVTSIVSAHCRRRAALLLQDIEQYQDDPGFDGDASAAALRELDEATGKELKAVTGADLALVLVADANQMLRAPFYLGPGLDFRP